MLTAKFREIFAQCKDNIKMVTRDFNKTESYVCQVLENCTHYTGNRALSLKNVIMHWLSQEAKESEYLNSIEPET